jgi:hypothetical protein
LQAAELGQFGECRTQILGGGQDRVTKLVLLLTAIRSSVWDLLGSVKSMFVSFSEDTDRTGLELCKSFSEKALRISSVESIVTKRVAVGEPFVKVLTLATKRLNARRREIDRRAFFVSTQSFAGFQRLLRFVGPNRGALYLQRDFRLSNATFKVAPVGAKNRSRTL